MSLRAWQKLIYKRWWCDTQLIVINYRSRRVKVYNLTFSHRYFKLFDLAPIHRLFIATKMMVENGAGDFHPTQLVTYYLLLSYSLSL